jgi:hypothetical protein
MKICLVVSWPFMIAHIGSLFTIGVFQVGRNWLGFLQTYLRQESVCQRRRLPVCLAWFCVLELLSLITVFFKTKF